MERKVSAEHQVDASSCAGSICTATATAYFVLKRLGRREGRQAKADKALCSRFVAWEKTRVPSEACESRARFLAVRLLAKLQALASVAHAPQRVLG